MEPSSSQNDQPALVSSDIESLTSIYSEAAAYLSKLSAQLEALETTQTTLLHSYHATSTALADIRSYNAVAPVMELVPTYTAKITRLKQLMMQQKTQVEKMRARAEDLRKVKKGNAQMLKKRWEEERERDKSLAARMVGAGHNDAGEVKTERGEGELSGPIIPDTGVAGGEVQRDDEPLSSQSRQQEGFRRPEAPLDTPGASTPPTMVIPTRTVVKRRKKARQAEIE
ncbi:hypothetical protein ABW20_dc0108278 [Dactylellina cionopaga]|nr:hypothetical protein ABW20_dc0108278 [Dactylellina cionopaga]